MIRVLGAVFCGLNVAALLCAAAPAVAEDPGRGIAPTFFNRDIGFKVAGSISARCTIDQSSHEGSFGDVVDGRRGGNRDAELDLALTLDCNSPFRVLMTSRNGGLVTQAQGSAAFRNSIDYSAALRLSDGRETAACDSQDMARGGEREDRCVFRFREQTGAGGLATIKLSMNSDPRPLLAGTYSDRLTVRITPLMGGDD